MKAKIISICVKCSDMFSADLKGDKDKLIGEYEGYVPKFFPEEHYGDYVMLEIELETGKILNWKAPSEKQIQEFVESKDFIINNEDEEE